MTPNSVNTDCNKRPHRHVRKIAKATISFVMSICLFAGLSVHLSIRSRGTNPLSMDGFAMNLIFEYFRKSVEKIQVALKSDKNNGYSAIRPKRMFDHIYPQLFLEFKIFQTKVVVTIDTHFMFNNLFF